MRDQGQQHEQRPQRDQGGQAGGEEAEAERGAGQRAAAQGMLRHQRQAVIERGGGGKEGGGGLDLVGMHQQAEAADGDQGGAPPGLLSDKVSRRPGQAGNHDADEQA